MEFSTPIPLLRFPAGTPLVPANVDFHPSFPPGATAVAYHLATSTLPNGEVLLSAIPMDNTSISVHSAVLTSATNAIVQVSWRHATDYTAKLVATPTTGISVIYDFALPTDSGEQDVVLEGLRPGVTYNIWGLLEKAGKALLSTNSATVSTPAAGSIQSVAFVHDNEAAPTCIFITAKNVDPGCGDAELVFRFGDRILTRVAVTNDLFTTADHVYEYRPDETTVYGEETRFSVEVVSSAAGETFSSGRVQSTVYALKDHNTYTWIGPDGGDWSDKANWASTGAFGNGFPNSFHGTSPFVNFTSETARVHVNGHFRAPGFRLDGDFPEQTVTLVGDGTNTTSLSLMKFFETDNLSGRRDHRTLAFDNVKVINVLPEGLQNRTDLQYQGAWLTGYVVRAQHAAAICVTGAVDAARLILVGDRVELHVVSNATVSAAYNVSMGGPYSRLVVDDGVVITPEVKIGCDSGNFPDRFTPGTGVTFKGSRPLVKTLRYGAQDCTNAQDTVFVVPVGGYSAPPLDLRGTQYTINGYPTFVQGPHIFKVDPSSPGLLGTTFETLLVDARGSIPFGGKAQTGVLRRPLSDHFTFDGATLSQSTWLGLHHNPPGLVIIVR